MHRLIIATTLPALCLSLESSSSSISPSKHTTPAQNQFHVAPMQCYTNAPLRKLFHFLTPSSIKWTEMEKVDDIYPKSITTKTKTLSSVDYLQDALEKRLGSPNDVSNNNNLVLQLGSNDPIRLEQCVQYTVEMGYAQNLKEINLNCGCPAIDSGGAATYGASLMKDPHLTGKLVEAVRKGLDAAGTSNRPAISVKCRIAVFENPESMRPLGTTDYVYLKEYIETIHNAGANHVILHARPAILSGLSPVKNRIVPQLDHEFVESIAADFSGKVDVTLNGGITSLSQLQSLQEKSSNNKVVSPISSHMAGRWCLRRPLDLIGVEGLLQKDNNNTLDSFSMAQDAIQKYVNEAVMWAQQKQQQQQRFTMADLCLPLFLVVEQLKDDYDYEYEQGDNPSQHMVPLLSYEEIELLYDTVQEGVLQLEEFSNNSGKKKKKRSNNNSNNDDINFKRLSSSFKSLVGTKVANKWKRNRAEL